MTSTNPSQTENRNGLEMTALWLDHYTRH